LLSQAGRGSWLGIAAVPHLPPTAKVIGRCRSSLLWALSRRLIASGKPPVLAPFPTMEACPGAKITLRNGARIIEKTWRADD
jgi:hypothetical protein